MYIIHTFVLQILFIHSNQFKMTIVQTPNAQPAKVSMATLLNGKTRHDRNKVRPSTNAKIEKPLTAAQLAIQVTFLKEQLAAAKKAEKVVATAKTPIYLKENVSGKQLAGAFKGHRKAVEAATFTLSGCLKLIIKQGIFYKAQSITELGITQVVPALSDLYPTVKVKDITPANLKPYMGAKQIVRVSDGLIANGYERFTIGQTLGLIKAYLKVANGYVPKAAKVVTVK